MVRQSQSTKVKVSRSQIVRSVASSSAIETNERTLVIEQRLNSKKRHFANLSLAL